MSRSLLGAAHLCGPRVKISVSVLTDVLKKEIENCWTNFNKNFISGIVTGCRISTQVFWLKKDNRHFGRRPKPIKECLTHLNIACAHDIFCERKQKMDALQTSCHELFANVHLYLRIFILYHFTSLVYLVFGILIVFYNAFRQICVLPVLP
jgi:hypothetical protein